MLNGRPFLRLFALTLLALLGLLSVGGFSAAPPALAASSGSAVVRSAPAKLSPNLEESLGHARAAFVWIPQCANFAA